MKPIKLKELQDVLKFCIEDFNYIDLQIKESNKVHSSYITDSERYIGMFNKYGDYIVEAILPSEYTDAIALCIKEWKDESKN